MDADCEHDWRRGPSRQLTLFQMICVKCWQQRLMPDTEASTWPAWSDEDYWNNLDHIEGDLAPEIRRMRDTP